MKISYEGIGFMLVTFPDESATEGNVCKINQSGCAEDCMTNDLFCGVVHSVEKTMAAVQLEGFAKAHYSGTKPEMGYVKMTADGIGGVCVNNSGREYLVVQVNENDRTVTMKL